MTEDLREEIAIALFTGILYGGNRDEWDLLSDDPDTFPPTYSKNWYRCGAEDVMAIVRKAQAEAWDRGVTYAHGRFNAGYDSTMAADNPYRVQRADPEPQPGDGPEYHADHAFWLARQKGGAA